MSTNTTCLGYLDGMSKIEIYFVHVIKPKEPIKVQLLPLSQVFWPSTMDKLKLAGWNLGWVFNFSYGRSFAPCTFFITAKQPNLEWKTSAKQVLSSLLLAFILLAQTLHQCQYGPEAVFLVVCNFSVNELWVT